jgi:hypothetical protein
LRPTSRRFATAGRARPEHRHLESILEVYVAIGADAAQEPAVLAAASQEHVLAPIDLSPGTLERPGQAT